jgi:hypothetical protein
MSNKILSYGVLFMFWLFGSHVEAQDTDPLAVVQQQLDYYNAQNLEGFVSVFAPDAAVFYTLGDTAPRLVGHEALRGAYGKLFQDHPENRSVLQGRLVQGNYVIDHEYITGRAEPMSMVAIYEVKEGKISRCWFLR